ncbi:MAG: enoyl-CoA hydratase/isomerase family protein [Acidimicrobiaceae bacterium]|nr:enoyl-CoA hydratase/isomerase family protein [Acidimicrobiaceae bacterium]
MNRPEKLNAADLSMQRSLRDVWKAIARDETIGAVVLTGAGRAFSAGGDFVLLNELAAGNRAMSDELSHINHELMQTMLLLNAPVVAAINGPAVGFGAALAALCDIVVMAETAYIQEPHVKYGLPASPACQLVWPQLMSQIVAKELLMSGREVRAEEAVRLGLANRVVADGRALGTAIDIAQELAALPRSGVATIKRAFNHPLAERAGRPEDARGTHDIVWPEDMQPRTTR